MRAAASWSGWLLMLGLWMGCGSKESIPDVAVESQVAPAAEPAPAVDQAQLAATLGELTQAVRRYGMEQRQAPKDLQELVAKGYLPAVPAAPAGKKFAIDKKLQVYLADQ